MENTAVNKIELMDKYMVSVYKWTLASAILGLLWTCFAILILGKVHLSIAGFAVFFIPPIVTIIKNKKTLPEGSGKRLVVYLASIAGLIILLSSIIIVSKIFNIKLLGGTLTVIFVIAFNVYWVIRKIKIWNKYKKENIIDERTAEINKKAVNIGFYVFVGICITAFILWTNLPFGAWNGFITFNKVYITVLFLNIIYVMIAVRSMAFLYMYKKGA